jgi:Mrp family chromosome partitioning ATPase
VEYENVIVDSPPMLVVADSLELAKSVDGVIVVVRSRRVTSDSAKELRALAGRLGIHIVGVVVTDVPMRPGYGSSSYSTYVTLPRTSGVDSPAAPVPIFWLVASARTGWMAAKAMTRC